MFWKKEEKKVEHYKGKIIGTNFSCGIIDLLLEDKTVKSIKIEDNYPRNSRSLELYRFLCDKKILIKGCGFDAIITIVDEGDDDGRNYERWD